jgi:hypothetical protein
MPNKLSVDIYDSTHFISTMLMIRRMEMETQQIDGILGLSTLAKKPVRF